MIKLEKHNKATNGHERKNQYHPAFCEAVTQILEHDCVEYLYEREHNLNTMPNRIDYLVIKKNPDAVSGLGLGKIFRTYNLFEYKSPNQELGIADYCLTMAYAYLYASYEDVRPEECTISFVREGRPRRLLGYLREEGFDIVLYEPGIYHITRSGHIGMQAVVTKELSKEYVWLKALTDKLTKEEAMYLAEEAEKEHDPAARRRIQSILDLTARINRNKEWMKEALRMGAFRDLFKEEFDKKDKEIRDLSEQLQSKDEQLQSQCEQLQSKDEQLQSQSEQLQSKDNQLAEKEEENTKLRKELEQIKNQLKEQMGKIAVL